MIPPRPPVHALLEANARWADTVDHEEPGFFHRLSLGQSPKVLWFGCADSRVPETVITGSRPGDIFVHRNIANQFHPDDQSALAVLSYSIGVVGIEHVVLAGHTHCGGAIACYQTAKSAAATTATTTADAHSSPSGPLAPDTPLHRWLTPLIEHVASLDLSSASDDATAHNMVVQENVKRQVDKLCDAEPIKQAWADGKPLWVHGWVYDVGTGRIKDLGVSRGPGGVRASSV